MWWQLVLGVLWVGQVLGRVEVLGIIRRTTRAAISKRLLLLLLLVVILRLRLLLLRLRDPDRGLDLARHRIEGSPQLLERHLLQRNVPIVLARSMNLFFFFFWIVLVLLTGLSWRAFRSSQQGGSGLRLVLAVGISNSLRRGILGSDSIRTLEMTWNPSR